MCEREKSDVQPNPFAAYILGAVNTATLTNCKPSRQTHKRALRSRIATSLKKACTIDSPLTIGNEYLV